MVGLYSRLSGKRDRHLGNDLAKSYQDSSPFGTTMLLNVAPAEAETRVIDLRIKAKDERVRSTIYNGYRQLILSEEIELTRLFYIEILGIEVNPHYKLLLYILSS